MKKILLFTLLLIPLFSLALPENRVTFENISNDITFLYGVSDGDNMSITSGAKYTNTIYSTKTVEGLIFLAERKGSDKPLNWVKNQLTANNIEWNNSNMTSKINGTTPPQKLNFAFYAYMPFSLDNIQYTCDNFILAQGNTGDNNNWWVFSNTTTPKSKNYGTGYVKLKCTNETVGNIEYFYVKATGNHSFQIYRPEIIIENISAN